jgi:ParB-like chromosome segregation protein Spo0J
MPAKIERTTMLASELMIDFNLYPRHAIDSTHVNDLLNALKAGAKLPPVVINQQDKRVVDGFHRLAMYKKAGTTRKCSSMPFG